MRTVLACHNCGGRLRVMAFVTAAGPASLLGASGTTSVLVPVRWRAHAAAHALVVISFTAIGLNGTPATGAVAVSSVGVLVCLVVICEIVVFILERSKRDELEAVDRLEEARRDVTELNHQLTVRIDDQLDALSRSGRLHQFVSPEVAQTLLGSMEQVQRKEITILFGDIVQFSELSEKVAPETLTAFPSDCGRLRFNGAA